MIHDDEWERWLDTVSPTGKPYRECMPDDLDRNMERLVNK